MNKRLMPIHYALKANAGLEPNVRNGLGVLLRSARALPSSAPSFCDVGGASPNGVELVLAEVRKHSGELSNAFDFQMEHHRTARAVPLTRRHSRQARPSRPKRALHAMAGRR